MPRKAYTRHKGSEVREQEIIRAGLACFTEHGYANTTLEDIRRRSGATNGSIYHFFSSKEGLAAAIYVQAIADYQKRILAALENNPRARAGVHEVVKCHLDWVKDNPDWARYLMEMRHASFMANAERAIAVKNREFITGFINWLTPHLKSGAIRPMPPDIFVSLILGPCQEYVRTWLGGCSFTELSAAKEELAAAAWLVVRGAKGERP
ncbi:MAG: TetR/AcrR family transcriptional regulator [Candidatus Abyssubacteria bacterium]